VTTAKKKILVVDDASPVVVLCVNVLQALGYAVKGRAGKPDLEARAAIDGGLRVTTMPNDM